MVAAAVGIGSAVAGIAGSVINSNAASDAASTQAAAANRAADLAMQQYQQTRTDLAPYRNFGQGQLGLLSGIFGTQSPGTAPSTQTTTTPIPSNQLNPLGPVGGGGLPQGFSVVPAQDGSPGFQLLDQSGNIIKQAATQAELTAGMPGQQGSTTTTTNIPGTPGGYSAPGQNILTANGLPGLTFQPEGGTIFKPTMAQLLATPGYQFINNQGQMGVANSNAAAGRGISGAALKGAAQYAEGLAGTTLGQQQAIFQSNLANQTGLFQQNLGNVLNPLMWGANLGQTAATQTGQQGISAVQNANQAAIGGANALAAGQVGSANAISGGLGNLGQAPLNYSLYSQLLNSGKGGNGGYQSGQSYSSLDPYGQSVAPPSYYQSPY